MPDPAWARDAFIYHLYPLGCLGAPRDNDFTAPVVHRLPRLVAWLDHIAALGATALLLGPVWESESHGYDTVDPTCVDRRLGDNRDLTELAAAAHARGIRVILDGVFHHVGRAFPAFRDVLERGHASPYASWFPIDWSQRSPYGDPFAYEAWAGHFNLVKLALDAPAARETMLRAAEGWIAAFDIDGLRLDAADRLDRGFQRELAARCRAVKPDFWLMGEIVHGDYRRAIAEADIDSVTDYQLHKALWSGFVEANLFETAYALDREFGPKGIYRGLALSTFVDNHDTMRIASRLRQAAQLYPLHVLLFAVPGIPTIYYGSEAGIPGVKGEGDDGPLRPALSVETLRDAPAPDLAVAIAKLAAIRAAHPALRHGDYETLHVAARTFAFLRRGAGEIAVIAVNAGGAAATVSFTHPALADRRFRDVLNPKRTAQARGGVLSLRLDPTWGAILIAAE